MSLYVKMQCTDGSGKTGTFAYDTSTDKQVSPTFSDVVELYAWLKENGYSQQPYCVKHPCGVYSK